MKIAFFAPHAAIWVHAFPEAVIAESLSKAGHNIEYITCEKDFSGFCVAMNAFGLTYASDIKGKENVCITCVRNKKILKSEFNLKGNDLSSYVSPDEIREIDLTLDSIDKSNFINFKIDGIELGRIALYEILLKYKKMDLLFDDDQFKEYFNALKNVLISYYSCRNYIRTERPDRILTYNTLYSVNHVWKLLADANNIPVYCLHAGENLSNRLSTLLIARDYTYFYRRELVRHWKKFCDLPLSQYLIENVLKHYRQLLAGKHFLAYSSGSNKLNIKDYFKITKKQKLVVAAMSSLDELFAGDSVGCIKIPDDLMFKDQLEWIEFLIKYFENKKEYFLLIRVHPREFPNKREVVKSESAKKLEKYFNHLPENIKVNLPSDNISIYDLARETDVFLNSSSTVGEEMGIFGIPVVIYSEELIYYPHDLNYLGNNREHYIFQIEKSLKDGRRWENVIRTFRWNALKFNMPLLDIRENFTREEVILEVSKQEFRKMIFYNLLRYINRILFGLPVRIVRVFKDSLIHKNKKKEEEVVSLIPDDLLRDLNNRSKDVKESHLLNEMLLNKWNTLLDCSKSRIEEFYSADEGVEAAEIKKGIKILMNLK